jgi:D-alanyl-D-alanine carboxypeptidase
MTLVRRLTLMLTVSLAGAFTLPVAADAASSCGATARHVSGSGDVCVSRTDGRGAKVVAAVRAVRAERKTAATVFGVWDGSRLLASGAMGDAMPAAPATRDLHLRISNVTESFVSTLLLQLVDAGKIRLSDPVSRWYPNFPRAREITVGMLARMTSGIGDYVTSDAFVSAFHANPFRHWDPAELTAIAASQPTTFAPGTSWAFSDSNYVLLGRILTRVGGAPLGRQLKNRILGPLGLRSTRMVTNGALPSPALHMYAAERGPYEETTYWDPTWATGTGNMISTLSDLGRWARALGTGSLLSHASAKLQTGTVNVGLGPLTTMRRYGLGIGIAGGWILANPQMPGFNGILAYLPSKRLSVVVWSSMTAANSPTIHYSTYFLISIAKALTGVAPPVNPNPRPNG